MFWKFFSVKKLLDVLFDDNWCTLSLPEAYGAQEAPDWLLAEAQ